MSTLWTPLGLGARRTYQQGVPLQRDGRWASDAYKAYVRSHGKDASLVANVMTKVEMDKRDPAGAGY